MDNHSEERNYSEQNNHLEQVSLSKEQANDKKQIGIREGFPTFSLSTLVSHPQATLFLRYASVVVAVGLAIGLRFFLQSILGDKAAYVTFFPAMVYGAWVAGWGGGLLECYSAAWMQPYSFFPLPMEF